ncbi:hypothetical protein BpHYR1_006749 [Brachionus plicatilis]|uniref:Uncharacterized protein n=1 Tax=Brachionus plicatilis TaxID=10195 RepID=A0A3M7RL15_BRAPC|nr:hypothetical protein BpHYR1_006749 [Brachionus plicatilis]
MASLSELARSGFKSISLLSSDSGLVRFPMHELMVCFRDELDELALEVTDFLSDFLSDLLSDLSSF